MGLGWVWWVLAGVLAYSAVRTAALVAAVAGEVRDPGHPLTGGWFRGPFVAVTAGWVLLTGVAAGAAAYAVVGGLVFPHDPELRRMFGAAAAIVGFVGGAISDVRLALWARGRLVPRLTAADLSGCLEAVQLGDPDDRLRAVRRIGRMGTHGAPAADALAAAARGDDDAGVRVAAWEGVSNLVMAGVAVPDDLLGHGLHDPDPRVRAVAACHAVRAATDDGNRPAVTEPAPGVVGALGEAVMLPGDVPGPDGEPLAEVAARALAALGPFAGPAVPALRAAVLDRTPPNFAAVPALVQVGPAAVPALAEMLGHPEPAVRREAADALGELGAAARDAVPALRAMTAAYPEDAPWAEFAVELIEANSGGG